MPTIRRVAILGGENGIEVEITSSQPVAPQTRVLSGPDRIVIDFPGAVPAGRLKGLTVNQGGIKAVRAGLFESNPPVTRVVLDLAAPSEYHLVPSGNTIIVKLGSAPVSVAPEPRGVLPPLTPGRLSAPNVKVDFEREKDFGVASRQLMLLSPIVAPPDVSPATTGSQVKTQDVLLEAQRLRDVGDFNTADMIKHVEGLFSGIPSVTLPRLFVRPEPPQQGERRKAVATARRTNQQIGAQPRAR